MILINIKSCENEKAIDKEYNDLYTIKIRERTEYVGHRYSFLCFDAKEHRYIKIGQQVYQKETQILEIIRDILNTLIPEKP